MNENWLPVPGYEGLYEISDEGRVYSHVSGKILKPQARGRYRAVTLHRPARVRYIHQMVLEAFVGARPEGFHARHLNDVQDDNRLVNLAWGTVSENMRDSVRNGSHTNASKTHCKWGHEYTPENTISDYRGGRRCRECRKRWRRAGYCREKATAKRRRQRARKREAAKGLLGPHPGK